MFSGIGLYLSIGVAVLVAGLTGTILYQKVEISKQETAIAAKEADLAKALVANAQSVETLKQLTIANHQAEDAALNLQRATAKVEDSGRHMDAAIEALEKSNADVRTFLATKLPDDLRRVLSRRPAAGGRVRPNGEDPAAAGAGGTVP